jgi:hypothetical protein
MGNILGWDLVSLQEKSGLSNGSVQSGSRCAWFVKSFQSFPIHRFPWFGLLVRQADEDPMGSMRPDPLERAAILDLADDRFGCGLFDGDLPAVSPTVTAKEERGHINFPTGWIQVPGLSLIGGRRVLGKLQQGSASPSHAVSTVDLKPCGILREVLREVLLFLLFALARCQSDAKGDEKNAEK